MTLISRSIFLGAALCISTFSTARDLPLDKIILPPGFKIEFYAENVPGARSMTLSPSGVLYVGTRRKKGTRDAIGDVYAVIDKNKDNRADEVITVASGLNTPNGVAFYKDALYIAEINRVLRLDNIDKQLKKPPKPIVVSDKFPSDTHHGWKFIAFGPDGKLYVPVGAPCNICDRGADGYANIQRMNPDGSDLEVVAHGVRNTVGFAWHPTTNELWFTDNGRDWLGDEMPPDELNRVSKAGEHFGYPYCHAGAFLDPEFGKDKKCSDYTPPVLALGAHVAALGMRFYTGKQFPKKYQEQIFIAQHGSWNRTAEAGPVGYRVMSVHLQENSVVSYEIFAEGWLQNKEPWGRPVDVLNMPDGSLLVSDDFAGAIYRISYQAPPQK